MVWSCEKSLEIRGRNESVGREKESRNTMENLKRYSEEEFGAIRSGCECYIGLRKMEKDHRRSDPYSNGKHGL